MIEQKIIDRFACTKSSREIKHIGLDLLAEEYNPKVLARLAKQNGLQQRLGYLADIAAEAGQIHGLVTQRIRDLSTLLYSSPERWEFLNLHLPEFAINMLKQSPESYYNKKWKIYANLQPVELADWVDLYITKKYVAASRR